MATYGQWEYGRPLWGGQPTQVVSPGSVTWTFAVGDPNLTNGTIVTASGATFVFTVADPVAVVGGVTLGFSSVGTKEYGTFQWGEATAIGFAFTVNAASTTQKTNVVAEGVSWTWTVADASISQSTDVAALGATLAFIVGDPSISQGTDVIALGATWVFTALDAELSSHATLSFSSVGTKEYGTFQWGEATAVAFEFLAHDASISNGTVVVVDPAAWTWSVANPTVSHGTNVPCAEATWTWSVQDPGIRRGQQPGPLNTIRENAPPPRRRLRIPEKRPEPVWVPLEEQHYRAAAVAMVAAEASVETKLAAAFALLDRPEL